jgi:ADP-heptose:LPS heptosyltransferase
MEAANHAGILTTLPQPIRKVLVMCESRLGSFLCSTPAIRALRAALPSAELVAITGAALHDLVTRSSHLDRGVTPPAPDWTNRARYARNLTQFFLAMQREEFDLAIQLHGYGLQSSPYFALFGARFNAGFVSRCDMPGIMDAPLFFPQEGHIVDRFLALSAHLGAPPRGRQTEYPLLPEDESGARSLLADAPRPLLGIHPGARSDQRRWNPGRFAQASLRLQQRFGGTILILGEQGDYEIGARIASLVPGPCLNLVGKTSLPVLGAVIKELSVLVTNDTGPAHVAYALATPTVTLFASATPTPFWPPERGPYRPLTCEAIDPGHYQWNWLDTISVPQVLAAAEEVLR